MASLALQVLALVRLVLLGAAQTGDSDLCGFDVSLLKDDVISCTKRPICDSQTETSLQNRPGVECVPKIPLCTSKQAAKFHCAEIADLPLCEKYSENVEDMKNRICRRRPLCFEHTFLTVEPASECEFVCTTIESSLFASRDRCRRLPLAGAPDEFGVLYRLRRTSMNPELLNLIEKLNANLRTNVEKPTFTGLLQCEDTVSIRLERQKSCIATPICTNQNEVDGARCLPPLVGCNRTEAKMYNCSPTAVTLEPCQKYLFDPRLANTCLARPLCEDRQLMNDSLEWQLLSFYQNGCEKLCPPGVINTPKAKKECRNRPTRHHDYFKVSANDPTRAVEFCSERDSRKRRPPKDCNPLPRCTSSGEAPWDFELNPFYAWKNECYVVEKCAHPKERRVVYCIDPERIAKKNEQKQTELKLSNMMSFSLGLLLALSFIVILVFLFGAVVVIKNAKRRIDVLIEKEQVSVRSFQSAPSSGHDSLQRPATGSATAPVK